MKTNHYENGWLTEISYAQVVDKIREGKEKAGLTYPAISLNVNEKVAYVRQVLSKSVADSTYYTLLARIFEYLYEDTRLLFDRSNSKIYILHQDSNVQSGIMFETADQLGISEMRRLIKRKKLELGLKYKEISEALESPEERKGKEKEGHAKEGYIRQAMSNAKPPRPDYRILTMLHNYLLPDCMMLTSMTPPSAFHIKLKGKAEDYVED